MPELTRRARLAVSALSGLLLGSYVGLLVSIYMSLAFGVFLVRMLLVCDAEVTQVDENDAGGGRGAVPRTDDDVLHFRPRRRTAADSPAHQA